MSSAGPSASSSSISPTTSSSSPATSSAGAPVNLMGSSSLPFSFLITFIAIFLFFLGCGLGSRRVTRQLRRNLGLQITPAIPPSSSQAAEKPAIWDICPSHPRIPTKSEDGGGHPAHRYAWENLSPLSATYVRTPVSANELDGSAHPEPEPPPRPWWTASSLFTSRGLMRTLAASPALARPPPPHLAGPGAPRRVAVVQPEVHWRGHRLPQFIARPLLPPGMHARVVTKDVPERAPGAEGSIDALQVGVVIAMPSPAASQARRARAKESDGGGKMADGSGAEIGEIEVSLEEEGLGDYMLGFARLPWAGEVDGQGGEGGRCV
ncbi:hypothetical protein C2E23DRAFT_922165 [Lenzites betulinus]|nr:hypothetical protein C2E23DRAFT_922165 [Lenzites betulinus]